MKPTTRLTITKSFYPTLKSQYLSDYFFFSPDLDAWQDLESVASCYSEVLIESSIAKKLPQKILKKLETNVRVISDIVEQVQKCSPVKVMALAPSDTHVHLLLPIIRQFDNFVIIVPSRKIRNENTIKILEEFAIDYIQIENQQLSHPKIEAFAPNVMLVAADWNWEYLTLSSMARKMNIPIIGIQEGPHDFFATAPIKWKSEIIYQKLNQYQSVDIFFAQGAINFRCNRWKNFAITGNNKIVLHEFNNAEKKPKVFINLNFTYVENKPAYESNRELWLSGVLNAVHKLGLDYIISQHPRDKGEVNDSNLIKSSPSLVQEQLESCSVVITRFSSILYEGIGLGLRAIYYNPHYEPMPVFNLNRDSGVDVAYSETDLIEALKRHLEYPNEHWKTNKTFLEHHCGSMDGRSLERIVHHLESVVRHQINEDAFQAQIDSTINVRRLVSKGAGLSVAICARMPSKIDSDRHYHVWIIGEALAHAGHRVCFVTDYIPTFFNDFRKYPLHHKIEICLSPNFKRNLPTGDIDIVLVFPIAESPSTDYNQIIEFARNRDSHLCLLNHENFNRFNKHSSVQGNQPLWDSWSLIVRQASIILSCSAEDQRYAEDNYLNRNPSAKLIYCYPAINTMEADATSKVAKENRILIFISDDLLVHQCINQISDLIGSSFKNHVIVLLCRRENIPNVILEKLSLKAKKLGASLVFIYFLKDYDKFREIRRAKLVLFPSLSEGFAYPPIEALYCQTPCVAFDIPVLREICGNWLVSAPRNDWQALKKCLEKVLIEPPDLTEVPAAIRKKAALEVYSNELTQIFRDLTEQAAKPWQNLSNLSLERYVNQLDQILDWKYYIAQNLCRKLSKLSSKLSPKSAQKQLGITSSIIACKEDVYEDLKNCQVIPENFYLSNIIFAASDHPEQVKGITQFIQYCWPQIIADIPKAKLFICGTICNKISIKLRQIIYKKDLSKQEIRRLMQMATISINPTMYSLGVQLKAVEATCIGLPSVTFSSGIEGLEDIDIAHQVAMVAEDFSQFTCYCIALLTEQKLWLDLHQSSLKLGRERFSEAVV